MNPWDILAWVVAIGLSITFTTFMFMFFLAILAGVTRRRRVRKHGTESTHTIMRGERTR